MESGTIVKWLKHEGEQVEKGEPLYELDTEKVTQEVEADFAGTLLKIAVEAGEVPVGETIAVIGDEGEEVQLSESPDGDSSREKPAPEQKPEPEALREPRHETTARIKASPLARRIARERGVDLEALTGTGPDGRIVAEDVERTRPALAAPAAPEPAAAGERRELTSVRRTIARRLTEAWQIPVFQLQASADMSRVSAVVDRLNEEGSDPKLTITDVITKACAGALMRHREVNAEWTDDAIVLHPSANVGLAVAAPQGLVVPAIHAAERLTLSEIAEARKDIVTRARDGKLRQDDLEGGTFTISNLGMFRVESFTAVLDPPQ